MMTKREFKGPNVFDLVIDWFQHAFQIPLFALRHIIFIARTRSYCRNARSLRTCWYHVQKNSMAARHDRCQVWPCTLIHSTRNSEGTLSIRSQSKIDIDKENKSATVLYNGHPQLVLNHCEYCYQYSNTVSILRPEHLFIQYSYSLPVQHRA